MCVARSSVVYRKVGDPAGLDLGAGVVEVALARRQTMGRPNLNDTA